jgi:hypothetical protein
MKNKMLHGKWNILSKIWDSCKKVEMRCELLKLMETTRKLESELYDTGEGYKILCSSRVIIHAL